MGDAPAQPRATLEGAVRVEKRPTPQTQQRNVPGAADAHPAVPDGKRPDPGALKQRRDADVPETEERVVRRRIMSKTTPMEMQTEMQEEKKRVREDVLQLMRMNTLPECCEKMPMQ